MTDMNLDDLMDRRRGVRAVAKAVHGLHEKLGLSPDIVFEGAIKGVMTLMVNAGLTAGEISAMFDDCGQAALALDRNQPRAEQ